jgi:glycosyltransferase involved in cell wall biosynthesis
LYVLEAIVVLQHCRKNQIRHLHAHLGQTPAAVAWFVTEIGNRWPGEAGTWTWSVTIHGWHEFVNEREFALADKIAAATFVVGISDFTRSQLLRIGDPTTWSKMQVVRCGLDLTKHPFAERPPRTEGAPTVTMTARLSPEKGHLVLLDALRQLADRGVIVRARLIGDGPFRATVEQAIADHGLAEQVELLGALDQDQVRHEVAKADAFVLPTFAEGLPVVIMEAMAAGTPVVTTPISGIPELVVDGVTGYLASPGRADQLADAIARVFADPEQARLVVKNARRAVETNHDVALNVRQLEQAFCSVASRATA